ncbi:MAG: DsbA family protein [Rhizobium sp.]|nr:DsbA family protein [Rhizobium sp.]
MKKQPEWTPKGRTTPGFKVEMPSSRNFDVLMGHCINLLLNLKWLQQLQEAETMESCMDRRHFLPTLAAVSLLAVPSLGLAQTTPSIASRLVEPTDLPDKVFGNVEAPVTIVEYASITCHHCMRFHTETWPALKQKYIDTGKVRFIMREFPLDQLATAGFMLARCSGEQRWYPTLDLLYRTKETWGHAEKPVEALLSTVRFAGFTKETFEACLSDEKLYRGIMSTAQRATKEFGVNSTPTFFVNGEKHTGALTLDQFDKILAPLLAPKP